MKSVDYTVCANKIVSIHVSKVANGVNSRTCVLLIIKNLLLARANSVP